MQDAKSARIKGGERLTDADRLYLRGLYDGSTLYADQGVGRLLRMLEQNGVLQNTIVVVGADHGEAFGEDGWTVRHGAEDTYDEVLHVPLIMAGPEIPQGRREPRLAGNIDVVPTLVERLGLKTSARTDGVSLLRTPRRVARLPGLPVRVVAPVGAARHPLQVRVAPRAAPGRLVSGARQPGRPGGVHPGGAARGREAQGPSREGPGTTLVLVRGPEARVLLFRRGPGPGQRVAAFRQRRWRSRETEGQGLGPSRRGVDAAPPLARPATRLPARKRHYRLLVEMLCAQQFEGQPASSLAARGNEPGFRQVHCGTQAPGAGTYRFEDLGAHQGPEGGLALQVVVLVDDNAGARERFAQLLLGRGDTAEASSDRLEQLRALGYVQ